MSDEKRYFARVRWCAGDVTSLAERLGIEITPEQAEEFLKKNETRMQDRIVEHGWEIMETLLREHRPELEASDDKMLDDAVDDPE